MIENPNKFDEADSDLMLTDPCWIESANYYSIF